MTVAAPMSAADVGCRVRLPGRGVLGIEMEAMDVQEPTLCSEARASERRELLLAASIEELSCSDAELRRRGVTT